MNKQDFLKIYSKRTVYKKDDFSIYVFWKLVHHKDGTATVYFMDGYNDIRSEFLQGAYIEDELKGFETGDQFHAKFSTMGGITHAEKLEVQESMIKRHRQYAGLSRVKMSQEFDIPIRTIEDWENGKHKCPSYVEKLIIEKLDTYKNGEAI